MLPSTGVGHHLSRVPQRPQRLLCQVRSIPGALPFRLLLLKLELLRKQGPSSFELFKHGIDRVRMVLEDPLESAAVPNVKQPPLRPTGVRDEARHLVPTVIDEPVLISSLLPVADLVTRHPPLQHQVVLTSRRAQGME